MSRFNARLLRLAYSLVWLALLPGAFLYLLWRARRQPEYLRHWPERLGFAPRLPAGPVIWLHAVSVGETRAAAPLVHALRARYPGYTLLLTHATPTGRATGAELFGDQVTQAYLPYDLPGLGTLFLARAHPDIGLFIETELWPNHFAACRRRGIPLFLVNARLSERSARGYGRVRSLTAATLAQLQGIAAQTEADAARLAALGGTAITVCGNLKFDVAAPALTDARAAELRQLFGERPVFLAASTREGEEALILAPILAQRPAGALLVLVPRHPQRFEAVASLVHEQGLTLVRRSDGQPAGEAEVYLGDSMGEMAAYYAASDVAFIGGSLLPLGGQNLIEACAAGVPVLIGPHTWNFADAAEEAVACGAALRVADARALAEKVESLLANPAERARMRQAGLAFTEAHRGATARIMALLQPALAG